jgi:hypothetical protein
MKAIWKYQLFVADTLQALEMPKDSRIIYVAEQNGAICLWALVSISPKATTETRHFIIHGTGHPVRAQESYVGSAQIGTFVWHVFEEEA